MIDVIIPAYNSHETIVQTLFSIGMQNNLKDLNIYIVNDGGNNYNEIVNNFKNLMNISELTLSSNKGPGVARDYGIKNSKSKYIVFIDSDDVFLYYNSLEVLYNIISKNDYDIVVSNFKEETDNGYLDHIKDTIFMHGKIYKREFLEKNDIHFNESYHNEDNGFNQLLFLHEPKCLFINDETYLWKNNKKSITRKNDHEYQISGLNGYIYNITWALNEGIKRNCNKEKIAVLAFCAYFAVYFYYIEFNEKSLLKNINQIYKITLKYPLSENNKNNIYKSEYDALINDNNKKIFEKPSISLKEYEERIKTYDNSNEL